MSSPALVPELYVTDFVKSRLFYTQIVNFSVEYERKDPLFAYLSYQGSHLMIQELDPREDPAFITGGFAYPFGRGINFQITTNDVEQLASSLRLHNYPVRRGVQDSWYAVGNVLRGCRQLLVQDPDGYLFRFSQELGEVPR